MFTAKGAYILGILFVLFVPTGTVFLAFKESISMCDVSINGGKVESYVLLYLYFFDSLASCSWGWV